MKKLLWFIGGVASFMAVMWFFKVPSDLELWRTLLGGVALGLTAICMEHV